MARIGFVGLVKIELPGGGAIVRLTDGGTFVWGGETYGPRDATFGTLGAMESLEEGIGVEVPAAKITLHPPSTAAAATLVAPGNQTAGVRAWIAEFNADSGAIVGTPQIAFDGFLDQPRLARTGDALMLDLTIVSRLEWLLAFNIGNSLSPAFHKSIWAGETGEDQATGLTIPDAWGVEAPFTNLGPGVGGGGIALEDRSWTQER